MFLAVRHHRLFRLHELVGVDCRVNDISVSAKFSFSLPFHIWLWNFNLNSTAQARKRRENAICNVWNAWRFPLGTLWLSTQREEILVKNEFSISSAMPFPRFSINNIYNFAAQQKKASWSSQYSLFHSHDEKNTNPTRSRRESRRRGRWEIIIKKYCQDFSKTFSVLPFSCEPTANETWKKRDDFFVLSFYSMLQSVRTMRIWTIPFATTQQFTTVSHQPTNTERSWRGKKFVEISPKPTAPPVTTPPRSTRCQALFIKTLRTRGGWKKSVRREFSIRQKKRLWNMWKQFNTTRVWVFDFEQLFFSRVHWAELESCCW